MLFAYLLQISADSTKALIAENAAEFKTYDPFGVGMAVIGMAVVFSSLLLLYILFANVVKVLNIKIRKPVKNGGDIPAVSASSDITGEVNAAIAMALYLHNNELHDQESAILTIQKIQRAYSPWSSKIYSLRKYPRQ